MKKDILLFDVDGTIAISGQKIDSDMKNIFDDLYKKYDLGIVGGGRYEKIIEQLDNKSNLFSHIFAECGCVYYKNNELVYKKKLKDHKLYSRINELIKLSLNFLSCVDYSLTGHFIDMRNGIIYISLIGMQASQQEREEFIKLNEKNDYRKKLLNILISHAKLYNFFDELYILEGGSVGIGIYPKEWDKIQILDELNNYNKIYYFGDKYKEDGNDYNMINHDKVFGHCIDIVDDTKRILREKFK
jgi:phosphomannomutase